MAKFALVVLFVTVVLTWVSCGTALPWQYRYNPPSHPRRFQGWTVTSEELLALPSTNEYNIVRVAPPAGFVRPHHVSRREIRRSRLPQQHGEPDREYAFVVPSEEMLSYYS